MISVELVLVVRAAAAKRRSSSAVEVLMEIRRIRARLRHEKHVKSKGLRRTAERRTDCELTFLDSGQQVVLRSERVNNIITIMTFLDLGVVFTVILNLQFNLRSKSLLSI